MADSFRADADSIAGAADDLAEAAHILYGGMIDLNVLDQVTAPATHLYLGDALRSFGRYAHDQYNDAIAILAGLSTKLQATADTYRGVDDATQNDMTTLLTGSTYRNAEERRS
jgi:hypothetical protein